MLGAPPPLISRASVFHRYPSCGGFVFLVCSSDDDPDRIVRQRPLQRLGLIRRSKTDRIERYQPTVRLI